LGENYVLLLTVSRRNFHGIFLWEVTMFLAACLIALVFAIFAAFFTGSILEKIVVRSFGPF
jgi:hypothetical protein